VREGGLIIDGSLSGNLSVQAGILQGTGDGFTTGLIRGMTVIGNGTGVGDAVLSPGSNGVGVLTSTGLLAMGSDAVFRFELDSLGMIGDSMAANGIAISSSASFTGFDLAVLGTPLAQGTTFIALNNTSFDAITGAFGNLPEGGFFPVGVNLFQASYVGGDGNDLALVAVPEPGSAVMLLAGMGMMLAGRRRRNAQR
jgi:PEP-CTERM motif